jgi:predicted permease
MEGILRDVRFGLRGLVKAPGFTAVATISLALGIGANTTIFTLINAVRLKMMPVEDPGRLVVLRWAAPEGATTPNRSLWGSSRRENGQYTSTSFSYPAFLALRDRNQAFSSMFAFVNMGRVSVAADGEAGLARAQMVTAGMFETLGIRPARGRSIAADDDRAGAPPVAVVSHAYWERRFGGDPGVLGRRVDVNGKAFEIVGVAPKGFTGIDTGNADDLWLPLQQLTLISPESVGNGDSFLRNDNYFVLMMARLQPDTSLAAAQSHANGIFQAQALEGLQTAGPPPGASPGAAQVVAPSIVLDPGGAGLDQVRRDLERPLNILMAVVAAVALIACANVANLLLARAAMRQREIAVRLSLGTNRGRLVRQLLTESGLLAALGTLLGTGLAFGGGRAMLALMARGERPMVLDLTPDLRVLAFTVVLALATTLLFGLAPALRATNLEPFQTLRDTAASAGGGRTLGLARGFVVFQVALSLTLLASAGLFIRTLQNLKKVEVGFEESGLLVFSVNAAQAGYRGAELHDLYERIQTGLEGIPGVLSASMTPHALLSGSSMNRSLTAAGYVPAPNERTSARVLLVGNRFFETVRLRVPQGRVFEPRDREGAPLVAIANQAFVRKYFKGENAIGRTFSYGLGSPQQPPIEIVGVAADARYDRLRGDFPPTIYQPFRQAMNFPGPMTFSVRANRAPLSIAPDVRKAVAAVHSGLPIYEMKTLDAQIDQLLQAERLFAGLTTFFGALALALVCVGLYGIVSYGVAVRTTEIGVRMALGARAEDVMSMVLRETGRLVSKGVAIGVPLALGVSYAAARFADGLLFGVDAVDAPSLAAALAVMAVIGVLAGALPAKRASSVAPMKALRCD